MTACASVGALSSQLLASLDPDASGALNAVSQLATSDTCLLLPPRKPCMGFSPFNGQFNHIDPGI